MKRTFKSLLGFAALAVALLGSNLVAPKAQAAEIAPCVQYNGNAVYPGSLGANSFFKVCFPTGQIVNTARRNEIFNAIQALPRKNANETILNLRDILQVRGVTYLYFYDRNSYNAWVQLAYPGQPTFVDNTARCGTTHTNSNGSIMIAAIFEICEYSPTNRVQNPNLVRTTFHETGHALDFAIAETYGTNATNNYGRSTAWKALMKYDLEQLTPAGWTDPAQYDAFRKANFICGIFQSIPLSPLEIAFMGTPSGAVCDASGNLGSFYTNQNPRQIFEEKFPYFVANTNGLATDQSAGDLWAQLFVIRHDTIGSGQGAFFLKQTDQAIGKGSYIVTTATFRCTKIAMHYFYINPYQTPPLSAWVGTSCPAVTW